MPSSSSFPINQRKRHIGVSSNDMKQHQQQLPLIVRCTCLFDLCCDSGAPSSHGCIICAADTRISLTLTLTRCSCTQCVVTTLQPYSSWYWYWRWYDGVSILFHRQSTCKDHELMSSCIWRVTTSTTGSRTRPRIDAPEQRYSPVSISIRSEKNVRDLQTRG